MSNQQVSKAVADEQQTFYLFMAFRFVIKFVFFLN
jgi:hypothetical protein